jgi:hypothetical protein
MIGWVFALSAAAAGAAQAGLLGRAKRGPHPLALLVRVGLVALILVLAARAGQLLAGSAGWFAGFVCAAAIVQWRLR